MKFTAKTSQVAVVDDFLSDESWNEVWKFLQHTIYIPVTEGGWNGAWRLDDGPVMRGPSIAYGDIEQAEHRYPTNMAIDLLLKALLDHASEFSSQLGEFKKSWNAMTALPMLYPRETGLYWHRDAPTWAGSYTYYAHKEWNVEWGGALLIASDPEIEKLSDDYGVFLQPSRSIMGVKEKHSFGAYIDNSKANELLMNRGMGTYIFPKPNRLVVISAGNAHTVSKVHAAAGDHLRASVSGFFQKPR